MHVVVFHHSEENTDRGEFSTFKRPLLYGFFIKSLPKKLKLIQKKRKKKDMQSNSYKFLYVIHILLYFLFNFLFMIYEVSIAFHMLA